MKEQQNQQQEKELKVGVEKYLSVSTVHITQEDCQKLSWPQEGLPIQVVAHENGWWVAVYDEQMLKEDIFPCMRVYGYSEAFINVIKMASKTNCLWINLDYNGYFVEGLGFCDW